MDVLEYSVHRGLAFCFAYLYLLKREFGFHLEPAFTNNGFSNWRTASASLKSRHETAGHKFCCRDME